MLTSWTDFNYLLPNLFFTCITLGILTNSKTAISRTNSIPNGIALMYLGITSLNVGYYWAGSVTILNGLIWLLVAYIRPIK